MASGLRRLDFGRAIGQRFSRNCQSAPPTQCRFYSDHAPSAAASLASIDTPKSKSPFNNKTTTTASSSFTNPIVLPERQRGLRTPRSGNPNATQSIQRFMRRVDQNAASASSSSNLNSQYGDSSGDNLTTAERLERATQGIALSRQISRKWRAGDVYAPHDLSWSEGEKWRKRGKPGMDVMDVLDLNPLDEYKNFSIMSEYITPMGRIQRRDVTGLRPVNQRRMAKAIRRSMGLGIMPSVHKHPEILRMKMQRQMDQSRRLSRTQ